MNLLNDRRSEFNRYVWDHAADAFQMSFDERRELSDEEVSFLANMHKIILDPEDERATASLRDHIQSAPQYFSLVLQIVGLTRNKIISDLRGNAEAARLKITIPSNYTGIPKSAIWVLAGPYLLKRLRAVLGIVDPKRPTLAQVYQSINQSTWSGYIRQERAKRSGHEAEYRMATLLFSLRLPFVPSEKAENPLCRDAQIDGISFDIVIPNVCEPKVVFKATVHTANIGQYGESKDHLEIDEARRWLNSIPENRRPLLVALIDGVGFRSNSAGLNGVLTKSDEFCQFRTIWKAIVVASSAMKTPVEIFLPRQTLSEFEPFLVRYRYRKFCYAREDIDNVVGLIEAGEALIRPLNHGSKRDAT